MQTHAELQAGYLASMLAAHHMQLAQIESQKLIIPSLNQHMHKRAALSLPVLHKDRKLISQVSVGMLGSSLCPFSAAVVGCLAFFSALGGSLCP